VVDDDDDYFYSEEALDIIVEVMRVCDICNLM